MDPNNPIVQLCVEGMECERKEQFGRAHALFFRAWEQSTNDFESCIAAHYVAWHQACPIDSLRWNQESLDRANAVNDNSVQDFYPSLYLNMGKAHEDLGDRKLAKRFYELAATHCDSLSSERYDSIVRDGIMRGLQRVS